MQAVELRAGSLRLALRPDLGASIAGLWHDGVPVLRSTEPDALSGPRESACFALLPYSNRLGHRRFVWQGVEYTTMPNFESSAHSLHGVGWLRRWSVTAQDAAGVTLAYRHEPDGDWPFPFEAEQRVELAAGSLRSTLWVRNTGTRDQPMGLGWHPYFPKRPASHLEMNVGTRWNSDAWQIPTEAVAQRGLDDDVSAMALDHCFGGWSGAAHIEDACFRLRLWSTLPYAVVFTPAGKPHFCVEPVSHVNDAIHFPDPAAHGLVKLAHGQAMQAEMTLQIEPR
jgi:aldose 1-epimerase